MNKSPDFYLLTKTFLTKHFLFTTEEGKKVLK